MPQHSNICLTWLAVRPSSTEEEDADGKAILAAPTMVVFPARCSLFKSISSFNLIVLSRISGGHASNGKDCEDVLHKHVERLFGKRILYFVVVVDVL